MPILNPHTLEVFSRSPGQTRRVGIRLGALLKPGDLICLSGDLGSGKTTFVQGISQGWGSLDPVTSPTFVLVNIYRKPDGKNLHHLDAYRLQNEYEAYDLDLEQMLETGSLVVEWPEKIVRALPQEHLWVELSWNSAEHRDLVFLPKGKRYENLISEFRKQVYGG